MIDSSKSEWLIRSSFSIITLWAYLVFGNGIAVFILGHQPSNIELGFVAIGIFLMSYVIGSLLIRGIRKPGMDEA